MAGAAPRRPTCPGSPPISRYPTAAPAPVLELSTSWRNPPTRPARGQRRLRGGATTIGGRACAALPPRRRARHRARARCWPTSQAEREWVADHLQRRYRQAADDGVVPPTAAVLVRRNADAAPMATALRARGVPVEVVGLAGLLSVPEVADVVAMLRLVADPSAGAAAMRVLTGPRWRLGARDVAALWRRAVALDGGRPARSGESAEQIAAGGRATGRHRRPGRRARRSGPGRRLFGGRVSARHRRSRRS